MQEQTAETIPVANPFTPDLAACPQVEYARLRAECPISRLPYIGMALISRHEDVMWALRHPEIFSSEVSDLIALGTERPMIPQQLDPPRQTRYRKILDPQFSRRRMAELEPRVRQHAVELIDAVIDRGECEFDADFAIPLPCTAFLGLMGLPQEELGLFLELKDGIIRPPVPITDLEAGREYRRRTGRRIYDYFERLIDERLVHPRDDIMSYLVRAELDGEKLSRNEILDICFLFLLGGLDTVTATLGCSIAYLAQNPDQRQRIAADPQKIPAAVEELLRWETPVMALPRLVRQDVVLGGHPFKPGEMVTLLIGAANTDEAAFPNASVVDFDRDANRHIAFGAGPHRCLGSHLARMELRVGLEEWHRRIPHYAIKPGERPVYTPGIREVRYLPLVWEVRAR